MLGTLPSHVGHCEPYLQNPLLPYVSALVQPDLSFFPCLVILFFLLLFFFLCCPFMIKLFNLMFHVKVPSQVIP